MNVIYFHLMNFLANQQADSRIRKVLKEKSNEHVTFRYSRLLKHIVFKLGKGFEKPMARSFDDMYNEAIEEVNRINCERSQTLNQLYREYHNSEDAL